MVTTDDRIRVAKSFIVYPANPATQEHRIFAHDGTFNLIIKTFPASESEETAIAYATEIANNREVIIERQNDPANLSNFFK